WARPRPRRPRRGWRVRGYLGSRRRGCGRSCPSSRAPVGRAGGRGARRAQGASDTHHAGGQLGERPPEPGRRDHLGERAGRDETLSEQQYEAEEGCPLGDPEDGPGRAVDAGEEECAGDAVGESAEQMAGEVDRDEDDRTPDRVGQDRAEEMARDERRADSRTPRGCREPAGEQSAEANALAAETAHISPEREGNQEDEKERIDLVHGRPPAPTGTAGPEAERRRGLDGSPRSAAQRAL